MAFCNRCGSPVEDGAIKCANCGEYILQQRPRTQYCVKCGAEVSSDAGVCPMCNAPVPKIKLRKVRSLLNTHPDDPSKKRSATIRRIVALLFIGDVLRHIFQPAIQNCT